MKRVRLLIAVGAMTAVTVTDGAAAQGNWSGGASLPSPVSYAGSATLNGLTYVFGGCGDNSCDTVLVGNEGYNATTDSWAPEANIPTARGEPGVAIAGGLIYAMGGQVSPNGSTSANEAYNPSTNAWTSEAPLPTARYGPAAATGSDGRIYTFGGYPGTGSTIYNLVEVYDPGTNSWTCSKGDTAPGCTASTLAPVPEPTNGGVAVAVKSTIYLIVGENGPNAPTGDVLAYNVKTGKWKKHPVTKMPTPRDYLGAALTPGKTGLLYAIGGSTVGNGYGPTSANEAYSFKTKTWTTEAALPTAVSGPAVAITTRGTIQAAGGVDQSQNATNQNELYTP